jgi:hypothetical protein
MNDYDHGYERHRGSFEGSTTQYVQHILDEHADGLTSEQIERLAAANGGVSQGDWTEIDSIHAIAHGYGPGSGYPGTPAVIVASRGGESVERPIDFAGWEPIALILSTAGVTGVIVSYDDHGPITYSKRG